MLSDCIWVPSDHTKLALPDHLCGREKRDSKESTIEPEEIAEQQSDEEIKVSRTVISEAVPPDSIVKSSEDDEPSDAFSHAAHLANTRAV